MTGFNLYINDKYLGNIDRIKGEVDKSMLMVEDVKYSSFSN